MPRSPQPLCCSRCPHRSAPPPIPHLCPRAAPRLLCACRRLQLSGLDLTGTISPSLADLPKLQQVGVGVRMWVVWVGGWCGWVGGWVGGWVWGGGAAAAAAACCRWGEAWNGLLPVCLRRWEPSRRRAQQLLVGDRLACRPVAGGRPPVCAANPSHFPGSHRAPTRLPCCALLPSPGRPVRQSAGGRRLAVVLSWCLPVSAHVPPDGCPAVSPARFRWTCRTTSWRASFPSPGRRATATRPNSSPCSCTTTG